MSEPGVLDLSMYRGDDYVHQLVFKNTATPAVAHDLSSYTFEAQIRDRPENGTVVFAEFTVDDSLKDEGIIVISLSPDQTRIPPGYWDFEAKTGGFKKTWLKGKVEMDGDTTQGLMEDSG